MNAEHRGLRLDVCFGHAAVQGDPDLTERMAANLIDNAIRYNLPGGSVEVRTETRYGHAMLTVANTGPPVPADKIDQLFQPFQRLPADRATHPDGHGHGLSIVHAIATAHDACLDTRIGPGGGLTVMVQFPQAASHARKHQAPAPARPATLLGTARAGTGARESGYGNVPAPQDPHSNRPDDRDPPQR
jgi:signal transduction histidine kinase